MATGVEETANEADVSASAVPTSGRWERPLTIAFVVAITATMIAWIAFLGWAGLKLLEAILP